MSDVRKWLEVINLAQYADAFEANDIEMRFASIGASTMTGSRTGRKTPSLIGLLTELMHFAPLRVDLMTAP